MNWNLVKQVLFLPGDASPMISLIYWALLVMFAALEFFIPQFQAANRVNRWPTNFGLGLINLALFPLMPVSVLWAATWAQHNGIGLLNLLGGSWWLLAIVAAVAILSFTEYAVHFIFHKTPWFWRLHRVHHLDTALDVSTGLRHHPLEMALVLLIDIPVAILFGLSPWAVIAYGTANAMFALFSHANIRFPARLDRVLRLLFVTPGVHAAHHSSHQPETDSNYGTVFTIWDRLFGTYRDLDAERLAALQFGLSEVRDDRAADLWWQLKSPAIQLDGAPVMTQSDTSRR